MKKIIYLVMVVMMASYVNAQGFGNCNFGRYTFGNCAVETSSGGSGGGGDGSPISLAVYYNLFSQFSSFNKKAEPNILNNITISLIVPESQEIGDYLIAGKCELGDGSPNATSSRKIKIMNKQQIEILKDS